MDLQRLRIFVAVAEAGGFSKAARGLSLVQSAISRQIQLLEEETGLVLFRRTGRGVVMTENGAIVFERANQILDLVASFNEDIQQMSHAPSGVVSIAVPPTLGVVLLSPLVETLQKTHPLIRLRITEGFGAHINDLLEQSALDLALLYDAPRKRIVATEHLFDEEMFLVGPPTMHETAEVSLEELIRLPLILPTRVHRSQLDDALASIGIKLNVKFEIDSVVTSLEMVRMGHGYMITPSASVYREVQRGELRLRRFAGGRFKRAVLMAYAPDRRVSRASAVVASAIKSTFKTLIEKGYWREHALP